MKRYLQSLIVVGIIAGFFFLTPQSIVAAGNLYITPNQLTGGIGGTVTVSVRTNIQSDPVNAVQANITYPADKLEFVRVNSTASPFNIQAESSGGGGSVRIARGIIGSGLTGDRLIGSITFKVKQNSGTATLGFSGDSAIVSATSNTNVLSGTAGSTITLSDAVPTPTPAPEKTIELSNIQVEEVTYTSAIISWETSINADSTVEYGLSDKFGLTAHDAVATSSHRLTLDSPLIIPGTTYMFRVKSAIEEDNETVSETLKFTTKGYTAVLKIEDSNANPLANTQVTISTPSGPISAKTDENGIATFTGLPDGTLVVIVQTNSGTESSTIAINPLEAGAEENLDVSPQEFTIKVAGVSEVKSPLPRPLLLIIGIPVIAVFVILIIWLIIRTSRTNTVPENTLE